MGSIYKITCVTSGKSYIGQTINDPKVRINSHLNCKSDGSLLLKQAVEKYNADAFTVEILHDSVCDTLLNDLEIKEIKKHNTLAPNGYNLTTGGASGIPSVETRQKISKTLKGRKLSPEHIRKSAEGNKGKKLSPQTRRKISEALKGKKGKERSPETRRKISEANKGRKHSPETRRKISKIQSKIQKGRKHSPETRRKISKGNKGKIVSPETRHKLSKAHTGKKHSSEHRKRISRALVHPNKSNAFEMLNSLPTDMPLKEKRKLFLNKFTEIPKSTLYRWFSEWYPETTHRSF